MSNSICKFLIRLPTKGGPNDYINVTLNAMSKAWGYVNIAANYKDSNDNTGYNLTSANQQFLIQYGYQGFLQFFGTGVFTGSFTFSYTFMDNYGPDGSIIYDSLSTN